MKKRFQIGKFWKGKTQPASVRKKRGIAIKKLWLEGKWKPWNKGKKLSLAHRKKLRLSNLIAYKNESLREKISRIKKMQYKNPALARKIDRIITRYYREHPLMRKKQAEKAVNYFKKNPLAFEKFLKAGKNPLKKHLKTKQGFLVRSKGEKQIADFLYENRINSEYESKTLFLGGYFCTPDFYLPDKKIYLEFYGGYPGSWKKKVIKNRLYRKFKIPFIAVTPSDLKELKELKSLKSLT